LFSDFSTTHDQDSNHPVDGRADARQCSTIWYRALKSATGTFAMLALIYTMIVEKDGNFQIFLVG